ncbi:hypothetical protein [Terrabacter terrigena]|uniref:Uncharacterized protein n=1 Tax=Terrabacter terrigena TaxID=574718 RepID=A0ABW3N1C8_9MICO
MIALTLAAPLVSLALMLFMQWLEKHTLTGQEHDASPAKGGELSRNQPANSARDESQFGSSMALMVLATVTLVSVVLVL